MELTLDEMENQIYRLAHGADIFHEIEKTYSSSKPGSISRARASFLLAGHFESKNFETSKKHFEETYSIAVASKNKKVLSDALHGKAVAAFKTGNLKEVNRLETEALELAIETGHPYRESFSNFVLSQIAIAYGVNESGIEYLHRSLATALREGFSILQVRLFGKLAELHLLCQDLTKARNYAENAILLAQQVSAEALSQKIRLATVELELKEYGKTGKLINDVRKTLPRDNRSLWCVTHTVLGKVHEAKRRYKKAEEEFRSALALADYANAERVRSNVHYHLSGLYLRMKKPEQALDEALKALADAEKAQDIYVRKEALRAIHDAYKALENYKEAYEYLEKYNKLVAESDTALLKSRLEYHALKTDFEKEKAMSDEKTRQSELLRIALEQKEKELTEKTRHLIKQTDALAQFRDDLRVLIRRSPSGDPYVDEIRNRLNTFPETAPNWKDFDKQFKEVHPEFMQNLGKRFPKLTSTEKKICALLRLNLTSSDIARLLKLSDRNIENHRYRIRGKLCLDSNNSIHEFLNAI